MIRIALFLLLLAATSPLTQAWCAPSCIDADGEAAILNNDLSSAKNEAVARAKWNAIEQVAGVEIKSQSVVQNMTLVDDAISRQTRGVVTGYKVLSEENRTDTFYVRINACVEPTTAREALSSLALNNSIAVFLPAKKPKAAGKGKSKDGSGDDTEEANILSENIIGKLAEQGFTVVDVAPTRAVDAAEIDKAMKSGNYMALRSMMYKFLSNLLLIGKVDYTISTRKGEDVGYGIAIPFNNVTVRLTYRLVTRDGSGNMVIVAAGTQEAKGVAANLEDAAAKGMQKLSDKLAPILIDKVARHIKGISRKVEVTIDGIADLPANFAMKDTLQQIAWVTGVEEKELGKFVVSYGENPIYLANSIVQKGNLKLVAFSPFALRFELSR